MSGAAGFHRSAYDNTRSYAGSRTLGGDRKRNVMSEILGGSMSQPAAPPPRQPSSVGSLLSGGCGDVQEDHRPLRVQAAHQAGSSAMDDVMHGRAVLDPTRGPKPNLKYQSGTSVLTALRPEETKSDEMGADPFAHLRARPKAAGPKPEAVAVAAPKDPFTEALAGVHRDLCQLGASTPRDAQGALVDYRPLLWLLAERGLPLNADASGTLIAHFDVNATIEYDAFIALVMNGLEERSFTVHYGAMNRLEEPPAAAPAPAPPPAPAPLQPRVAPTQPAIGSYDPSQWMMPLQPSLPQAPTDMTVATKRLLGGGSTAKAATNVDLARALNGGLGQHARRSDAEYAVTIGKSGQFR